MATYRVDYLTSEGTRGIWDDEQEFGDRGEAISHVERTLDYAKSRIPTITSLFLVEIVEKDIYVYSHSKRRK